MLKVGIDIGSTTIKAVVLNEGQIVFTYYKRHKSDIKAALLSLLSELKVKFAGQSEFEFSFSGSSALRFSSALSAPFVQEVYALQKAVDFLNPGTDVVIELGGEDAKILFMPPVNECRMNGTCAGGTGAFIDQMAELLDTNSDGLNELSKSALTTYSIASRCGVFAKTDIQPLLNQGARREDIARSIFYSIVNQSVSGLAQGHKIKGNVLYLGGPLSFLSELRLAFDTTLQTKGTAPQNSLFYVALGSIYSGLCTAFNIDNLQNKIQNLQNITSSASIPPLFESADEYKEFVKEHEKDNECIEFADPQTAGDIYLGVDCGSTTIKVVLLDSQKRIVSSIYTQNKGRPVDIVVDFIKSELAKYPNLKIVSSCATGYGEDLIKNALSLDFGIVETMAHFKAAKHFAPDCDFIIDIGGQDIKCFKIRSGSIDSLFLNEACSSGCGSFLSTFAALAGYDIKEFSQLALYAKHPCDLGSRCTVFMNSSVKQVQKDGATTSDIAAGLSISVVKNALYKVIRISGDKLGNKIVVQGGTFTSDSVLRAFEREVGKHCIRPTIAGLMGAFGAALYAFENKGEKSTFLSLVELNNFSYKSTSINCKGCSNSCHLNICTFNGGKRFVSGNKCEKPLGIKEGASYNIFAYKRELLENYMQNNYKEREFNLGIPLALNVYEFLPFWYKFFTELGINLVVSNHPTRSAYIDAMYSVPSDTVCYPAKLAHASIHSLVQSGINNIFYPNMTYNLDEKMGDNHYNCPIVAYYPHLIGTNYDTSKINYIAPFVDFNNKKVLQKTLLTTLTSLKEKTGAAFKCDPQSIKKAYNSATVEYNAYRQKIYKKAEEYLDIAAKTGAKIIVLASRPYHIETEINHKIDTLITSLGAVVLTEDSIDYAKLGIAEASKKTSAVLNQWTYHSRLFAASHFVARTPNANFVQLVSFGCGIDAITQDECRRIIEAAGKIYTSIKIDEIDNLGAAKIRLRSLFSTLESK